MLNRGSKIYIAGHRGMIGTALLERLREQGYRNLLYKTHSELDLTRQADVETFFSAEKPEYVIMNAGVVSNAVNVRTKPAEILLDNAAMICNVISCAARYGTKKILYVCSAGCYPSDAATISLQNGIEVLREDALQPGRIDRLSERYYVMPKLLGAELCRIYQDTGRMQCVTVALTHVYGNCYYYNDEQRLPVYPALVKRFCDAAKTKQKNVVIWGTGKLHREFTHVSDVVNAYILLLEEESAAGVYNVGSGRMVSISELAERLKRITGFEGEIVYDPTKPDANEYHMLDTERIRNLGWNPQMVLEDGIRQSCDYYRQHYGT